MSAAEPFECMPIAEDLTPWEASVVTLADDAVMLTYSLREVRYLQGIISRDRCRTWEEPFFLKSSSGERIAGWRSSPLRLASGNLGIFYSTLPQQPGRDGPLGFRVSADEGQTWSEQSLVDSHFAIVRNGCARVLSDGRILCPAYRWISHHLEDAEQDGTQLSYSFAYFSDDEGCTWQRSANELMIRHNDVEYDLIDGRGFRLVEEEPAGLYEYLEFEKYGEPVEPIDGYKQPIDRTRYHRAPGAVRCAYSAITLVGSDAVICYDYGWRPDPVTGRRKHFGTKVKVVPCEWFTEG